MPHDRDGRWHEPVPGEAAHERRTDPARAGDGRSAEAVEQGRAEHDVIGGSIAPSGQATSASGGYGTGSGGESVVAESPAGAASVDVPGMPTSGGSGAGDAATSTAGEETETDWLRSEGDSRR